MPLPSSPPSLSHGSELNRAASVRSSGTSYCAGCQKGVGVPCILPLGLRRLWGPVEGEGVAAGSME